MMETFVSITYTLTGLAILLFLKPALSGRNKRENQIFVIFILAVGLYAFSEATSLLIRELALSILLQKVTITAGILIGVSWLSLAVAFSDGFALTRRYTTGVGLYVVVAVLGTWLNVGNVIIGAEADVIDALFWADPQGGFFVLLGVAYLQILIATVVFSIEAFKSATIRRKQALLLAVAILPAVLGSLSNAYVLSTDFSTWDFTIYGFTASAIMFGVAMYSGQFLDITPIARRTVMDNMEDAVITLDDDNRVVDCNPRGKELCNVTDSEVGLSAAAFFDSIQIDIQTLLKETDEAETVVSSEIDGETRHFQVSVISIDTSKTHGRVVIIRDITDQKAYEKQLQQQKTQLENKNERLDQFASVASHDLKGPLNIAVSYVNIARRSDDPEDSLDEIKNAIERGERLIDDLLGIARRGQEFEYEPVQLDELAIRAWEGVSTADGSVNIETDATVSADPSHLLRLFENLFRNSVEHGGTDVTVSVGTTADGIYVADDGVGIPASKRERLFEMGATHDSNGTGYGLAIVRDIVDGHDWGIEVSGSDSGGAQFEITGVEFTTS